MSLLKTREGRAIVIGIFIFVVIYPLGLVSMIINPQYWSLSAVGLYFFGIPVGILAILDTLRKLHKRKESQQQNKDDFPKLISNPVPVRCPYCNTMFQITPTAKPFRVKCPRCSRESRLK